jgi:hypothetical protein
MRAHLVLKSAARQGLESAFPTAATIKERQASTETVQKAETAARKLGFKVVNATPLQVTIEGPKEKFEKAFSCRLKPAGGSRKTTAKGRPAAKKPARKKTPPAETPVAAELWTWEQTPELPRELQDAVQEIVLPQAIALH